MVTTNLHDRWIPLGRSGGWIPDTRTYLGLIDDIHGTAELRGVKIQFEPSVKQLSKAANETYRRNLYAR